MPARRRPITELGFTLLELLVVVALIALSTAAVTLALRDGNEQALEREGQRLVALLEAGRAQSRMQGVPVVWEPTSGGFRFVGTTPDPNNRDALDQQRNWLQAGLSARVVQPASAVRLVLGPEPLIDPQTLLLQHGDAQLWIRTDGLGPFVWQRQAP